MRQLDLFSAHPQSAPRASTPNSSRRAVDCPVVLESLFRHGQRRAAPSCWAWPEKACRFGVGGVPNAAQLRTVL